MRRTLASLLAVALAALPAPAVAQRPIVWRAQATPVAVRAGTDVTVNLSARLEAGWHLYSHTQGQGGPIPTTIKLPPEQPFALAGPITAPAPARSFDANFGIMVETFEDSVTFAVPVRVTADSPPGPHPLQVHVRYQVCTRTVCLPPHTEKLAVSVTVQRADATTPGARRRAAR
ncbi:MAG TPA: protein-disulfide reductase DsbD N-terminal domain-containing protein [Gemmatimonadales bacterium]|nr:protein-disulfide reductase DsbD N-terminal domain-containing protein [Gemmatimonadales bacterium]